MKELDRAIYLATKLFENDVDKGGNPYIRHLFNVMNSLDNETEKIAGVLHDICEDKDISLNKLRCLRYSKEVIDIIELVTRMESETYREFIDRIYYSNNIGAINVKLADLNDNMDISRIKNITNKDLNRIQKRYMPAYLKLINKKFEKS